MATAGIVHFSDFPSATTLTGSEGLAGLQGGANVQITPTQLFSFVSTTPGTLSNKTVDTAAAGDSSGAIASTQFVTAAIASAAPTNAPTFTGNATFAGASFSGAVSFTSRPSFAGATPWDSANFMPANYLPLTGGTMSGPISFSGSPAQIGPQVGTAALNAGITLGPSNIVLRSPVSTGEFIFTATGASGATWAALSGSGFACSVPAIFNSRPTFNGATPWDSANLSSPFQTTGGSMNGPLTVAGPGNHLVFDYNQDGNQVYIYQGAGNALNFGVGAFQNSSGAGVATQTAGTTVGISSGAFTISNFSGATFGGSVTPVNALSVTPTSFTCAVPGSFTSRPTFAGATPWDSGNFNPANFASLGGDVSFTGVTSFNMIGTNVIADPNGAIATLEVSQQSTTAGAAFMSFVNQERFGAYFGLDTDNQFKIGGWSYGEISHVLLHDGNYTSYALPITGGTITNSLQVNSNVKALGANGTGQFSAVDGNTCWNFYNDGSNCYLLKNSGGATGFDGSRPFMVSHATSVVTIDATGAGTTFGGNISVPNVQITSDLRLKTIDGSIHDATEIVQATRAYRGSKNGAPGFFLIAQEARKITPELVGESTTMIDSDPDPLLHLDLLSYVPILLEEVKRLRCEVERLKIQ